MGFIRNYALKTAIKKALLEVSDPVEKIWEETPGISSFGEAFMVLARHSPYISDDLVTDTWEGTFMGVISTTAQSYLPSSPLINSQKELATLVALVTEWVSVKGGSPANVYREFS